MRYEPVLFCVVGLCLVCCLVFGCFWLRSVFSLARIFSYLIEFNQGDLRLSAPAPVFVQKKGGRASSGSAAVHEGLYSNGVECGRQANFTKASAVHKGELLNFFDLCVRDVHFPQ